LQDAVYKGLTSTTDIQQKTDQLHLIQDDQDT